MKKNNKLKIDKISKDISNKDMLLIMKIEKLWMEKKYIKILKVIKQTDIYLDLKKNNKIKLKSLTRIIYLFLISFQIKFFMDSIHLTNLIKSNVSFYKKIISKINLDIFLAIIFLDIINMNESLTDKNQLEEIINNFLDSNNKKSFFISILYQVYAEKQKDINKKIKFYERAIKANDKNHKAHYSLGQIYSKQNKYEKSKIHFEKAIELRPKELIYIESVIDIYHKLGKNNKINKILETIFEENFFIIKKIMILEAEARIKEKNRIIQNLYHNLKNKIPKIYFSIENIIEDLEEEGKPVPNTLRNSLAVAKDLEDTANAVLGASKISKDYLLSAIKSKNNQVSLKEIINNSILNALNYIPLEEEDNNIIKKFNINNMEEVLKFIKNKLFNINLNIDYLENCYLSKKNIIDNKYSVTSVLSNMFDELIINLFKYTIKGGFIDIKISNGENLVFIFKNKSNINNNNTKSTGKGRYIIETTMQSVGGEYKHYWEDDIYITEISLENYWKQND